MLKPGFMRRLMQDLSPNCDLCCFPLKATESVLFFQVSQFVWFKWVTHTLFWTSSASSPCLDGHWPLRLFVSTSSWPSVIHYAAVWRWVSLLIVSVIWKAIRPPLLSIVFFCCCCWSGIHNVTRELLQTLSQKHNRYHLDRKYGTKHGQNSWYIE